MYIKKIDLTIRMSIICSVLFIIFVGGYTSSYRSQTNDYLDKYNDPSFFVQEVYVKTFAQGYKLEKASEKKADYDKFAVYNNDYNVSANIILKRNYHLENYKDIGKYNIFSVINGEKIVFYKDAFIIRGTYTIKVADRLNHLVFIYFQNIKLFFKNIKNETFSSKSIKRLNYVLSSDFIISYIALITLTLKFNKYFIYDKNFRMKNKYTKNYLPISHLSLVISIITIIIMRVLKIIGFMSPNVTNQLLLENIFKLNLPLDTIYSEVFIYWFIVKMPFLSILADFYFIIKNIPPKRIVIYIFIILFSNFLLYVLLFTTFFLKIFLISVFVIFVFIYYLFGESIKKAIPNRNSA